MPTEMAAIFEKWCVDCLSIISSTYGGMFTLFVDVSAKAIWVAASLGHPCYIRYRRNSGPLSYRVRKVGYVDCHDVNTVVNWAFFDFIRLE